MEPENHIHVFKDTVVPATCKETGYTLHKCDCGYEHKDSFTPVNNHNFELTEETAPSCTENGVRVFRCTVCGESSTTTINASGHAWGDWNVQKYPTCTDEGTQVRFCARCGARENSVLPAKGHNLTSPKKSETEKGMIEYFCDNCGETIILPEKQKKEKKKPSKKGIKWLIASVFSILLIAGIIVAMNPIIIPLYHYTTAKSQIKKGNYAEAYYHLNDCIDFKDSRSLLRKFTVAYESRETIYYDYEGKKRDVYKSKYDEYGNITSYISYDKDGKVTSTTEYKNEYDNDGNLIKKTVIAEDKITESVYEYEFYEGTTYSPDDAPQTSKIKTEYTYEYKFNDDGTKKQIETEKDGEAVSKTKYEYNDEGKLTKITSYGEGGKITSKTKYEYDNDGNLITAEVYEDDTLSNKNEYNTKGRIISTAYYDDNLKMEYQYNDKGHLTLMSTDDSDNSFELSLEYEYDKKGKIVSITPDFNYESDEEDIEDVEIEFECDSNNNLSLLKLIFKAEIDGEESEMEITFEYEYDENNTLRSQTNKTSTPDDSSSFSVQEFDENGILFNQTSYHNDKKYSASKYEKPIILYNPETP